MTSLEFAKQKSLTLSKPDLSSAGRIDPRIVSLCSTINDKTNFFTLSSCSGRSYIYTGVGTKRSSATNPFRRFRVNHEKVNDAEVYFDTKNIETSKYVEGEWDEPRSTNDTYQQIGVDEGLSGLQAEPRNDDDQGEDDDRYDQSVWLRYEPMILHVSCSSPSSANALVTACKSVFKNTAITNSTNSSKKKSVVVAIWGDESLDMPIVDNKGDSLFSGNRAWLKTIVNKKHERNWAKMDRLVEAMNSLDESEITSEEDAGDSNGGNIPRHYDVVGDVVILHPSKEMGEMTPVELREIGEKLLKINRRCRVACAQISPYSGEERKLEDSLSIIAGDVRSPIITTHSEHGIKCIVNLSSTFFSVRMVGERTRLMNSVARGEKVLVLFAGVGLEALLIAAKTEASSVTCVEKNSEACTCIRRGVKLLERNKAANEKASEKVRVVEGDALEILQDLAAANETFDRVIAPRPKNVEKDGAADGDLSPTDIGGREFLHAIVPVLRKNGRAEVHWYDFAADWELPSLTRTKNGILDEVCKYEGVDDVTFLWAGKASSMSVAARQYRCCVDFRLGSTHLNG